MNKYVIYTIITGGYNDLMQPLFADERFDYILFSNDFKIERIGVWQVMPIPQLTEINPDDNKRLSRYPKTHPEILLKNYEASLYIDANLQILDKWVYERFLELVYKKVLYAGVRLQLTGRDCIYEHAFDMTARGIVHDYEALDQCHALYKKGFPQHFGLNENNIIYRYHDDLMRKVDEEWWWWITNYTFRDQFSFMYCLWKYNIPVQEHFLPENEDSRTTIHFKYVEHDVKNRRTKFIKVDFFEKIRRKCYNIESGREKCLQIWMRAIQKNNPLGYLRIHIFGIFVLNIHRLLFKYVKNRI